MIVLYALLIKKTSRSTDMSIYLYCPETGNGKKKVAVGKSSTQKSYFLLGG